MIRQKLVRQTAMSVSSSTESTSMPSPPPLRRRRNSQDAKLYRQLSSDSLDSLLDAQPSSLPNDEDGRRCVAGSRRHSVACGVLYMDMHHRPTIKSAINSAVRRMSDACSLLSSAPSSTYNLSAPVQSKPKVEEVMLPQVLGTFHQNCLPPGYQKPSCSGEQSSSKRGILQINRRFSTDCPPPSYSDATTGWRQPGPRQKLLTRQNEIMACKSSLVAVEDDDCGNPSE